MKITASRPTSGDTSPLSSDYGGETAGIRIDIRGIVQGVGFRPFLHRTAEQYGICGWVRNTSSGLEGELEGTREGLMQFVRTVRTSPPPMASVEDVAFFPLKERRNFDRFVIRGSREAPGSTLVSPDIAICPDCARELCTPTDRRYRYPFINCTNCGPRYTIIDSLPYDRERTVMNDFPMCAFCSAEYHDIRDRRYHAQPDCCPDCGPQVFFVSAPGTASTTGEEAFRRSQELLRNGRAGEAVTVAERCPSLFELVPLLQTPGTLEFFNLCRLYGLPEPPLVNVSVFQALKRASDDPAVQDGLFAELRKLSRSHGSEDKVIILRKILRTDPENPEWLRQLKQAESACIPAFIQNAQQAIIDRDYPTLENLEEVLSSPDWRQVIPSVVLDKIRRTLEEEHQRQMRCRAGEILEKVEQAYRNRDLAAYQLANSRWTMLCKLDRYLPSEEENCRFAAVERYFHAEQKAADEEDEFGMVQSEFGF